MKFGEVLKPITWAIFLGGGFFQTFLEFSPRILGEDEAILTVAYFSRWVGEKPPTSYLLATFSSTNFPADMSFQLNSYQSLPFNRPSPERFFSR